MIYKHMDYIPFDINNPDCLHVTLSNRAYCSIINESLEHGYDETGGVLLGFIVGRRWFVLDVIDPGTNDTIHQVDLFQWDEDYVNATAQRMRRIYRHQPTILGFWHRHPGSMDFFSQQDVESTQKNLQNAKKGLISMLVNIDPALRMTFYYAKGPHFMPVRYDVGDEYFPVELLEYASPKEISQRHMGNQRGRLVRVSYMRNLQPPTAPGMERKYSVPADNDQASAGRKPESTGASVTPAAPKADPVTNAPERKPSETEPAAAPTTESPEQKIPAEVQDVQSSAVEFPAAQTPAVVSPAAETPAAESPTAEAPTVESPAAETPAENVPVESPDVDEPADEVADEVPAAEVSTDVPVTETPVETADEDDSADVSTDTEDTRSADSDEEPEKKNTVRGDWQQLSGS